MSQEDQNGVIRYTVKNKQTGVIDMKYYSILTLEKNNLADLFPVEMYDILNRSVCTNLKTHEGDMLWEHDIIIHEGVLLRIGFLGWKFVARQYPFGGAWFDLGEDEAYDAMMLQDYTLQPYN